ncbi:unnamed protein product [Protopolystoma xenopodis]|uniref:Uncharacterized protein n=1 Tax=Protopolystoma xenopodis TaxID=117903 RepID=A0A3S5BUC2_9PLAT|nr:unnamed protein product [Protopolystoma xenopodis]
MATESRLPSASPSGSSASSPSVCLRDIVTRRNAWLERVVAVIAVGVAIGVDVRVLGSRVLPRSQRRPSSSQASQRTASKATRSVGANCNEAGSNGDDGDGDGDGDMDEWLNQSRARSIASVDELHESGGELTWRRCAGGRSFSNTCCMLQSRRGRSTLTPPTRPPCGECAGTEWLQCIFQTGCWRSIRQRHDRDQDCHLDLDQALPDPDRRAASSQQKS